MKKIEMFENIFKLTSAIQTIAEAYQRSIRRNKDVLDFHEIIHAEDVPTIASTLQKEMIHAFTVSVFYSSLS